MIRHVHHHAKHVATRDEAEHSNESIHDAEYLEIQARIRTSAHGCRDGENAGEDMHYVVHRIDLKNAQEHSIGCRNSRHKAQNPDHENHYTEYPSYFLNHNK